MQRPVLHNYKFIFYIFSSQGRPFHFTFFVSNDIKLHPTDSERAEEFIQKHTGTLLTPPESFERWHQIGPFVETKLEVKESFIV